jgi:predicted MFS family arabinose efflux permease
MAQVELSAPPRLRDRPVFRSHWAANAVSSLGTSATVVILPTLLATYYHARRLVSLLTTAQALPGLLLAVPVGVWVDRMSRRRVLLACDLFSFMVLGCAVVLGIMGWLPAVGIVVLGVLLACSALSFEIAAAGMLPSLLPRQELTWGNARMTRNTYISRICAPPAAGAIFGAFPGPFVLLIDAISYLASALIIRRSAIEDLPSVREAGRRDSWRASLVEGARVVFQERQLTVLFVCAVIGSLALGLQIPLFYVLLAGQIKLSPFVIGVVLGINGAASLAATYAVPRVVRTIGVGRSMVLGSLMMSVGIAILAALPVSHGPAMVCAGLAEVVMGLGAPTYVIAQSSLRQAVIPLHIQGRVSAFRRLGMNGATPIGSAISVAFVGGVGMTRVGLMIACGLMAMSAVAAWRSALWRIVE